MDFFSVCNLLEVWEETKRVFGCPIVAGWRSSGPVRGDDLWWGCSRRFQHRGQLTYLSAPPPSAPLVLLSSSPPHPAAANCISARRHCHTPIRWGKKKIFFASLIFVGVIFLWCDPNAWKSLAAARTKPSAPPPFKHRRTLYIRLFMFFIYSVQPCQTLFHKSKLKNGLYVYSFFLNALLNKECEVQYKSHREGAMLSREDKATTIKQIDENNLIQCSGLIKQCNNIYVETQSISRLVNSFVMFVKGWNKVKWSICTSVALKGSGEACGHLLSFSHTLPG